MTAVFQWVLSWPANFYALVVVGMPPHQALMFVFQTMCVLLSVGLALLFSLNPRVSGKTARQTTKD
jgi:hypothetical protein